MVVFNNVNTALNVFEDFKDKKEKGKQLFVVSYDQEKAYDSVQAYTIKAIQYARRLHSICVIGSGPSNKLF